MKTAVFFCGLALALAPFLARAESYGDQNFFNIDKSYDEFGRSNLAAGLVLAGNGIYFYADNNWWGGLDAQSQGKYRAAFLDLDNEFSNNIRPKLTALFGSDVNPAVSRDGRITVLIHPMIKDAGGYINTGDGYKKIEVPASNEREMVYFNSRFADSPLAKAYLAHEFVHLITLAQKDISRHVREEVWLNEARAEYASTILGYDDLFAGSNFDRRVKSFANDPSKSLVNWANKPANYGAAHLFFQYLVDHYGINAAADTMKTEKTGIAAVEYALKKNGHDLSFKQLFRDWLVALAANDCALGDRYCYKLADLKNFVVAPKINYLPNSERLSLSVMYNTDYFSGNWQRIAGGGGDLRLDFSSDPADKFFVPYLLCDVSGKCVVGDMDTFADGKAGLFLADFGRKYSSLLLMPFSAGKTLGFNDYQANSVPYSLRIEINPKTAAAQPVIAEDGGQEAKIKSLLARIEAIKIEIARIQTLLAARQAAAAGAAWAAGLSCKAIAADLYFGVENYAQVACLQEFLKKQGSAIYGGAVSGRFSAETQAAVIRFQEKYAARILAPLGLKNGTGYVGSSTRALINSMLK